MVMVGVGVNVLLLNDEETRIGSANASAEVKSGVPEVSVLLVLVLGQTKFVSVLKTTMNRLKRACPPLL